MNHSAYCMMVRSTYDLWKKDKPKRQRKPMSYEAAPADPILKKLQATERACEKRDREGKFNSDFDAVQWCAKSIARKGLVQESKMYAYQFGDIMREAILRGVRPKTTKVKPVREAGWYNGHYVDEYGDYYTDM